MAKVCRTCGHYLPCEDNKDVCLSGKLVQEDKEAAVDPHFFRPPHPRFSCEYWEPRDDR